MTHSHLLIPRAHKSTFHNKHKHFTNMARCDITVKISHLIFLLSLFVAAAIFHNLLPVSHQTHSMSPYNAYHHIHVS